MNRQATLRRGLVSTSLRGLRSIGTFRLAGNSKRRKNKLLILCYHGLSLCDEHRWRPDLYITTAQFRQRLNCLRNTGATLLRLGDALARLKSESLPARSVVLTFDDGFYDFARNAVPVLSEFGYPSTIYLTTHYSNYRFPITNLILDYLLWKSEKTTISLPEFGFIGEISLQSFGDKQKLLERIKALFERNGLGTAARDEAAEKLALRLGVNYQEIVKRGMLQILCPERVSKIARDGVDVQLHTHRHRMPISEGLVRREIEDNRRQIVELTGKFPVHFCYPSGLYAPEYAPWLRACGVESATTCDRAFATRESDMMRLPRVLDDSRISAVRFEAIVSGLLV